MPLPLPSKGMKLPVRAGVGSEAGLEAPAEGDSSGCATGSDPENRVAIAMAAITATAASAIQSVGFLRSGGVRSSQLGGGVGCCPKGVRGSRPCASWNCVGRQFGSCEAQGLFAPFWGGCQLWLLMVRSSLPSGSVHRQRSPWAEQDGVAHDGA